MKATFNITYYLVQSRKNASGESPLYIISKQNSTKQFSYNTGIRLTKEQWDKRKKAPKTKTAEMLELEAKLAANYKALFDKGIPATLPDILKTPKKKVAAEPKKKVTGERVTIWCDDFIECGKYNAGRIQGVSTLRTNVKAWNPDATFSDFDFDDFVDYLTEEDVANNSQAKRLSALRLVARHAKLKLAPYKMMVKAKNAEKARLEYKDIISVMNTEAKPGIEQIAKDCFLLASFSGLRISDIKSLNRGTLHRYYYEVLMVKTTKRVMVTLHRDNEALFKKLLAQFPDGISLSRQKLSEALKEVFKRAGLTRKFIKVRMVGDKRVEETMEFWQAVAFHSGRSFYSRLLSDLGLSNEIIADELGHTDLNVTQGYIGSQPHLRRVKRVRTAIEVREKTMADLDAMLEEFEMELEAK